MSGIHLQQEGGRAWVFFPGGMSRGHHMTSHMTHDMTSHDTSHVMSQRLSKTQNN